MEFIRWSAIMTLTLTLHAQTPTAPPDSVPTMEQTVGFINDSFSKQGDITRSFSSQYRTTTYKYTARSVRLENACSLVVTSTTESSDHVTDTELAKLTKDSNSRETTRQALFLDRAAPRTVSVGTDDSSSPILYYVKIERAVFQWRALDVDQEGAARRRGFSR